MDEMALTCYQRCNTTNLWSSEISLRKWGRMKKKKTTTIGRRRRRWSWCWSGGQWTYLHTGNFNKVCLWTRKSVALFASPASGVLRMWGGLWVVDFGGNCKLACRREESFELSSIIKYRAHSCWWHGKGCDDDDDDDVNVNVNRSLCWCFWEHPTDLA